MFGSAIWKVYRTRLLRRPLRCSAKPRDLLTAAPGINRDSTIAARQGSDFEFSSLA